MRPVRSRSLAGAVAATAVAGATLGVASPAGAGGGCHRPSSEATGITVELVDLCMAPTVLHTDVGATVTFVNRDTTEHNISSNEFFADLPKFSHTWKRRFDTAGTYAYACLLHPGMTGAIVVDGGPAARMAGTTAAALGPVEHVAAESSGPASVPLPIAAAGALLIALAGLLTGRRLRPRRPAESGA